MNSFEYQPGQSKVWTVPAGIETTDQLVDHLIREGEVVKAAQDFVHALASQTQAVTGKLARLASAVHEYERMR